MIQSFSTICWQATSHGAMGAIPKVNKTEVNGRHLARLFHKKLVRLNRTWRRCQSAVLTWKGLYTQNSSLKTRSSTSNSIFRCSNGSAEVWCEKLWPCGIPARNSYVMAMLPRTRAIGVRRSMASTQTSLAHAPYSPDLVPEDFFLFSQMKRDLKGNVLPMSTKSNAMLRWR